MSFRKAMLLGKEKGVVGGMETHSRRGMEMGFACDLGPGGVEGGGGG